jgi:hypothetical protein
MKNKETRHLPVQSNPCRTCPFEGKEPINLSQERYVEIYTDVAGLDGQHLCHSANNEKICRGGRNIQLKIVKALGFVDEPTDEAFDQAMDEVLNSENKRS